jgi:hypothetical protein
VYHAIYVFNEEIHARREGIRDQGKGLAVELLNTVKIMLGRICLRVEIT